MKDLALSKKDVEVLQRIESVIDALEVRGIASSKFYDLCSELDACLKLFPTQQIMQDGVEEDKKALFVSLIKRLKNLEIYAGTQSEITTGLNTYIDGLDK
ncbi:hypothetical protein N8Z70_01680 [Candidatus Puniceispirillum sp.]|nr:hypothetical protein [Alphaproteobacteria bacterium]MDC1293737.1 hypothetical protein [Candidatus Puniceispirillum sp.]